MVYQVFSVRDSKGELFAAPFCMSNVALAIRKVSEFVNNPGSELSKYPGDFTLYHIGTFDEVSGVLTALSPVKLINVLSDFVQNPLEVRK